MANGQTNAAWWQNPELIASGVDAFGNLLGNFGTAGGNVAQRKLDEEADAYQRRVDHYNRLRQTRTNQYRHLDTLLQDQGQRANTLLGASPLGEEQTYVQRQKRLGGLGAALVNRGLPGGVTNTFANFDPLPYGDMATATALGERRKAKVNVDPNLHFGAMSSYGLGDTLAAEQGVSEYARVRASERMAREEAMAKMLQDQSKEAMAFYKEEQLRNEQQGGTTPVEEEKGTPWWRKALKMASIAAPIVAAPFTGGLSLAGIGAGAGVLGSLASGNRSVKDLVLAGGMGAIPMGGFGGAGNVAKQVAGESARSAIQRAILNPRALASIGSGAFEGPTGDTLRLASQFLPGAKGWELDPRNIADRPTIGAVPGGLTPFPQGPIMTPEQWASQELWRTRNDLGPIDPSVAQLGPDAIRQAIRPPSPIQPPGGGGTTRRPRSAPGLDAVGPGIVPGAGLPNPELVSGYRFPESVDPEREYAASIGAYPDTWRMDLDPATQAFRPAGGHPTHWNPPGFQSLESFAGTGLGYLGSRIPYVNPMTGAIAGEVVHQLHSEGIPTDGPEFFEMMINSGATAAQAYALRGIIRRGIKYIPGMGNVVDFVKNAARKMRGQGPAGSPVQQRLPLGPPTGGPPPVP